MENINVLILGAGVAGLSCAGLLAKQGICPQVLEKEDEKSFNTKGYMLGLLPLGGRVLNALNARKDYFDQSIQMESYEIHHSDGSLIKDFSLDFINKNYGSYRGISRSKLINILMNIVKNEKVNIKFGTTVESISRCSDETEVVFSDGQTNHFDAVIIADGLHSSTRDLVLSEDEYSSYKTGWGGWVSWLNECSISSYREYWGKGCFCPGG